MCEICVRVTSKTNPNDQVKDAQLTKRGHIIDVRPDGWGWTTTELTNPDWRMISLPNITVSQATAYLAAGTATPNTAEIAARRAFKFDIDANTLSTPMKNWIKDATRATPMFTLTFTSAQISVFIVAVPPATNRNFLGVANYKVIG